MASNPQRAAARRLRARLFDGCNGVRTIEQQVAVIEAALLMAEARGIRRVGAEEYSPWLADDLEARARRAAKAKR